MLREFLTGFGLFIGYYIVAASLLLIIRAFFQPQKELFRKMLHVACIMSVLILIYVFDTWYLAMLTSIVFAIALYPVITYIERFPKVMEMLIQRKNGEIKSSLIIVFFMMAMLIFIFWGWLGEEWKYIIIVSVMAWGFGDAAAALVGKAFGRNPIRHRLVEGTKTREGAIAMYSVSAIAILLCLMIYTSLPWYLCLSGALIVAPICAVVELISHHGLDTITVPFATAIPIFSLMILFSFMGG
jgi:dolichol kinase